MAGASTLVDNFGDGTLDAGLWTATDDSGVTGTETGGHYQWSIAGAGFAYGQIASNATYDLTGSYFAVEVVDAGNQSIGQLEVYQLIARVDTDTELFFTISGGFFGAWTRTSGTPNGLNFGVYNPAAHVWFRIREDSGTIYWDTSADGSSWSTFHSLPAPFAVTSMSLVVRAGEYGAGGSTTVVIDNVGGPPPLSVAPDGIAVSVGLGAPAVANSAMTVTPGGIAVATALGQPTVSQTFTTAPGGVAVGVATGNPTAADGSLTTAPTGLSVPVALGTPTASQSFTAAPTGIALSLALGTPAAAMTVLRDITIRVGSPEVSWAAGPPEASWTVEPPTLAWIAGPPQT